MLMSYMIPTKKNRQKFVARHDNAGWNARAAFCAAGKFFQYETGRAAQPSPPETAVLPMRTTLFTSRPHCLLWLADTWRKPRHAPFLKCRIIRHALSVCSPWRARPCQSQQGTADGVFQSRLFRDAPARWSPPAI